MSCVVKRSFETDLPSPYHTKRCRPMGVAPDPSVVAPLSPANFAFPSEAPRSTLESPFAFKQPSPLAPSPLSADVHEDGENTPFSFSRKRRELFPPAAAASQQPSPSAHRPVIVCADCGAATDKSAEDVVSLDEARFRVERAVRDAEMKLMREYDALLQEKLKEQFYTFSKFNQDHIHRHHAAQSLSYMC